MKRTFTIETSELDEKALFHHHRSDQIDFVFNSVLTSVINGARDKFIQDVKEHVKTTGEFVPSNDDAVISSFTLPNADERHAQAALKAEEEAAERERQARELLALTKAEEDARIRAAVEAALAERDVQNASE